MRLVEGFGGRQEAAARFGVSTERIRQWLEDGIPASRALDVEEATAKWLDPLKPIPAKEVLEYARRSKAAA